MLFVLVEVEDPSNVATEICDTASNVRAPKVTTAMQRAELLFTANFKELIVTFVFTFTEFSQNVPALQQPTERQRL